MRNGLNANWQWNEVAAMKRSDERKASGVVIEGLVADDDDSDQLTLPVNTRNVNRRSPCTIIQPVETVVRASNHAIRNHW